MDIPMLDNIIAAAFDLTGACILIGGAIVAIMFFTSRGDPEKVNKAKKALILVIVGAAIYFGAVAIKNVIYKIVVSGGPAVNPPTPPP